MGKIIIVSETFGKPCVTRFVKDYRKGWLFGKERISYSLDIREAMQFPENVDARLLKRVRELVMKGFSKNPHVDVLRTEMFCYLSEHSRFFVIVNDGEKGVPASGGYFSGFGHDGKAVFTDNVNDIQIELSEKSAQETLRTVQRTTGGKVRVGQIYLNVTNGLLDESFVLTCTSKKSGETKFFARLEGTRVRLVKTSHSAAKFTYEDAIAYFEHLKESNKSFLYAVLPKFKDNVNGNDIGEYMERKKISRSVAMTFKIGNYKRV